jgi:hypothetical protein
MFRVAPCILCYAPSRAFRTEGEAITYARRAAEAFNVTYSVYSLSTGKPRHVATFQPPRQSRARRGSR